MTNRLPVGVGSRGGSWHLLPFRSAYFINYRLTHSSYVIDDNRRRLLSHNIERLERVINELPNNALVQGNQHKARGA